MELQRKADDALAAFLKIIVDIHRANTCDQDPHRQRDELTDLSVYGRHPDIRERFKAVPGGYSVRMGFGLHIGWAIEGAIG
jgi:hypothetical protein